MERPGPVRVRQQADAQAAGAQLPEHARRRRRSWRMWVVHPSRWWVAASSITASVTSSPSSADAASRISASRQLSNVVVVRCQNRSSTRGQGGDEFVLRAGIETVGGEAPQIEQVGATEVARGEGPAPVEDDSLPAPRRSNAIRSNRLDHGSRAYAVRGYCGPSAGLPSLRICSRMSVPTRTVPVPASLVLVAERVEHRLAELLDTEIERWGALDRRPGRAAARPAPVRGRQRQAAASGVLPLGLRRRRRRPRQRRRDRHRRRVRAAAGIRARARRRHGRLGDPARRAHRPPRLRRPPRRSSAGEASPAGSAKASPSSSATSPTCTPTTSWPARPTEVAAIWNELRVELNVGQYLDVLGTARGDTDLPRARRIARYKSGKYTIERPLHVGAALAGRYDELHAALSAYGDPLGEAFQLRDDMLGAFGEETVTGKPVGDDLREGKPTPLLAVATARARPRAARRARAHRTAGPVTRATSPRSRPC